MDGAQGARQCANEAGEDVVNADMLIMKTSNKVLPPQICPNRRDTYKHAGTAVTRSPSCSGPCCHQQ